MARAAALAALLALAPALACASKKGSEPAVPKPRVVVETASGQRLAVDVELARTEAERRQGLMDRPSLAPEAGMLFLFDETSVHGFWMKNTLIPLDMLFVDAAGCVVTVHERAQPGSLDSIEADGPVSLVVELAGGTASNLGIGRGDRVTRPEAGWPRDPRPCSPPR